MSEPRYLSELFQIQPPNWGLRGDPYLWEDMKQAFANIPFPYSSPQLVADIRRIFKEKTGEELDNQVRPYVPAYDHGGTSSGKVSGRFWMSTAIPLLIAMRDIAEANMEEFDKILADGTARFMLRSHPCTPQ
jgi:molybdenum cofactor cytidylyltransferase